LGQPNTFFAPRYAAKWLGDNAAEFDDMKMSIPGILTASIFGFSMIGADICGFGAPSDPGSNT
jgi:alpha-glucosidase (family GH31 glycosyl hydrolase)